MGSACCIRVNETYSNQNKKNGAKNIVNESGDFIKKGGTFIMINKARNIRVEQNKFFKPKYYPIEDDYEILEKLGSGAYGVVYKIKNKQTNDIRSMKEIEKIKATKFFDDENILFEGEHLVNLDHINILKIYDYYVTDYYYKLVAEFIEGGELYETIINIKCFTEKTAARIIYQLLSAVSYLHSKDLVHRDIKPENCLVLKKMYLKKRLDQNALNKQESIENNQLLLLDNIDNNKQILDDNNTSRNIMNKNKIIVKKETNSTMNELNFDNNDEKINIKKKNSNYLNPIKEVINSHSDLFESKSKNHLFPHPSNISSIIPQDSQIKKMTKQDIIYNNLKKCLSYNSENKKKKLNDKSKVNISEKYSIKINETNGKEKRNHFEVKLNKIENNYLDDIEEEKLDLNNNIKYILDNNDEIVNNTINQDSSKIYSKKKLDSKHNIRKSNSLNSEIYDDSDINIVLIDFGACTKLKKGDKLSMKFGTPYYIAPEVLKNSYDHKADIWSCGIILYILLSGNPPFLGKDRKEILDQVQFKSINFTGVKWSKISEEAKSFLESLLERNPDKRISAEEALKNKWVNSWKKPLELNYSILNEVQENMKNFNAMEKFQQAILAYIVHINNSSYTFNEYRKIFKEFDANGDGVLSYNEFKEGYKKTFNKFVTDKELKGIIKKMDQNNDENIEYEEFLRVSIDQTKILNDKNLKLAFENFDLDKNGTLSKDEVMKVLVNADHEYIKELFNLIDIDKDGTLSFEEFKVMMNYLCKK